MHHMSLRAVSSITFTIKEKWHVCNLIQITKIKRFQLEAIMRHGLNAMTRDLSTVVERQIAQPRGLWN